MHNAPFNARLICAGLLKTKTTEQKAQVKDLESVSSEKDTLIEKYKMEIKEGDDLMPL